jgi:hypothetical protein
MADTYFYGHANQQHGPVDATTLKDLVKSGVLNHATLVWHSTLNAWTPLGAIPELAASTGANQPPPIPRQPLPPAYPAMPPVLQPAPYAAGYPAPPPIVYPQRPVYYAPSWHVIKKRDPLLIFLLSLITLGIYHVYILHVWASDINAILGRKKYEPMLVVILSLITFGFAIYYYKYSFASDLERAASEQNLPNRTTGLCSSVLSLSIASFVLGIVSNFFLNEATLMQFLIIMAWGIGLGWWAIVLIQKEFNMFSPE